MASLDSAGCLNIPCDFSPTKIFAERLENGAAEWPPLVVLVESDLLEAQKIILCNNKMTFSPNDKVLVAGELVNVEAVATIRAALDAL